MREQWAIRIVLITGLLVLLLAFLFSTLQNPVETKDITQNKDHISIIDLEPKYIEAGRQVYQQQNCSRCHSIAGEGNPRYPLDNVGAELSTKELRDYITGADHLHNTLPERILKLKQAYRSLPTNELDVLIVYMKSLHTN
ncbi:MAG: cytochrome c [Gammaproteobacteria bacterium]|nr:cytochrome c [Gammaproteobacteria bacterium]